MNHKMRQSLNYFGEFLQNKKLIPFYIRSLLYLKKTKMIIIKTFKYSRFSFIFFKSSVWNLIKYYISTNSTVIASLFPLSITFVVFHCIIYTMRIASIILDAILYLLFFLGSRIRLFIINHIWTLCTYLDI